MADEGKKWKELEEEADKIIRETNEMSHLRAEYEEDIRFRSKDDFAYLDGKNSKNHIALLIYGLIWLGVPICVGLFSIIQYGKDPFKNMDKNPLGIMLGIFYVLAPLTIFERSGWYDRNVIQLKDAIILKSRYEKAESLINRGMDGGWKGLVETGLFRLLELKENFSEMRDYDELVKKAPSWIEEQEKNEE